MGWIWPLGHGLLTPVPEYAAACPEDLYLLEPRAHIDFSLEAFVLK